MKTCQKTFDDSINICPKELFLLYIFTALYLKNSNWGKTRALLRKRTPSLFRVHTKKTKKSNEPILRKRRYRQMDGRTERQS